MIAGRRLLPRHDDVAPGPRARRDPAMLAAGSLALLGPGEIATRAIAASMSSRKGQRIG